jgi:[ribosomal protein S5]-alanine N-acetyltransferase
MMLTTTRLELVPTSLPLIEAELRSYAGLAAALEAVVPAGWPPGEYDRPAMQYFRERLAEHPEHAGWYGWYGLLRATAGSPRILIGASGFFGPPHEDAIVEIGYSVLPRYEGRGFATEMVSALAAHAFLSGRVHRIIAHTRTANTGSVRVLEKAGFRLAAPGREPGTIQYVCEYPHLQA